jgi:predicted SAM-dependent methyltransferase
MKLNLGCGPRHFTGFVNVDKFTACDVRADLRELPFPDDSAEFIQIIHVLEHIPFHDEEAVWREIARVLAPGGVLFAETPDLHALTVMFAQGHDGLTAFWDGSTDHFFGAGVESKDRKWGVVAEFLFGNQRDGGEYHVNGYTLGKFHDCAQLVGLEPVTGDIRFGGAYMPIILFHARKP